MEVLKRKTGIKYRNKITINGRLLKSPVFDRKYDCNQWLAEMKVLRAKHNVHGEDYKLHQKITLEEYSKNWLESKKSQGLAKSSFKNHEICFRVHIFPYFTNRDMKTIRRSEIEAFQIKIKENHNPKGTNIIVATLKSVFREAVKDGYLLKSPCENVKTLKSDKQLDSFWSKAEIDQFLKANYFHELHDFFLVAINSGMRLGEICGLCWDRVNFNNNTISITRTRDRNELKERTKTNIIRLLPMNSIVRATLLNIQKLNTHGSKFVFLEGNGQPIKVHHVYRKFKAAQKNAKIENTIRFHDLRHTFASQYIINGGNIYDLQKFLGHTNINMTTRYAHHTMDYLQQAMSGFTLGEVKQYPENENGPHSAHKNKLKDKFLIISEENQSVG